MRREGGGGRGGGGRRDYSGKFFLAEEVVVRYWRVESSRHSIDLAGERVRAVMELTSGKRKLSISARLIRPQLLVAQPESTKANYQPENDIKKNSTTRRSAHAVQWVLLRARQTTTELRRPHPTESSRARNTRHRECHRSTPQSKTRGQAARSTTTPQIGSYRVFILLTD